MASEASIYVLECPKCGCHFHSANPDSRIPKHQPRGRSHEPTLRHIPCVGSLNKGVMIGTKNAEYASICGIISTLLM
jgi:hypothetical protein